jgi:hypothetical protein
MQLCSDRTIRWQFLQTWKIKITKSQESDECAVDLMVGPFLSYGRRSKRDQEKKQRWLLCAPSTFQPSTTGCG